MPKVTRQQMIGFSLMQKRKAHAKHYGMTIEESQKTVTMTELMHDPLFARFGYTLNGNGTNADRG